MYYERLHSQARRVESWVRGQGSFSPWGIPWGMTGLVGPVSPLVRELGQESFNRVNAPVADPYLGYLHLGPRLRLGYLQ